MELLEQQRNQEVKQNLCEELKIDMRLVNSFFSLQCNFINLFSQAKYGEEFVPSWFVMSSYNWLGKQYKKALKQIKKEYNKTLRIEKCKTKK